jgi:hypothetical protein
MLGDSGAVAVVVETDEHAENVTAIRGALSALTHVWQIDGSRYEDIIGNIVARPDRVCRGRRDFPHDCLVALLPCCLVIPQFTG